MSRPRNPEKRKLPQGLYERNGYWSWRDRRTGKEWGIGRVSKGDAIAQALEAMNHPNVAEFRFRPRTDASALAALSHEEIVAAALGVSRQCGVYFLVAGGQVMYVGQSINVPRRISEHAMDSEHPFDAYHFVPVPRALLDDTEGAYIASLQPAWNINGRRQVEATWMRFECQSISP